MRLAWLPRSGFLPAALGLEHGRGRRDEKPRERKSVQLLQFLHTAFPEIRGHNDSRSPAISLIL